MSKDHTYPEEQKNSGWTKAWEEYKRKLQEKQYEEYCDCHERCPRCGKKKKKWGENSYVRS